MINTKGTTVLITAALIISAALFCYIAVPACTKNTRNNVRIEFLRQSSSGRDTFTNCIFNSSFKEISDYWHLGEKLHINSNLERYKDLNFNAVQIYDDIGNDYYGKPELPLKDVNTKRFRDFLDSIKGGGFYGFIERSRISRFCYGQRLVYKPAPDKNNTTFNYGFVYRKSERGNYETDNGRKVIHAVPNQSYGKSDSGYLCRDIYENLQHTDLFDFRQNDKGMWFIKPVMKIPEGTQASKRVVRIEVVPFAGGNPVKSIIINAGNFTGEGYNEIYTGLQTPLTVSGNTNPGELNFGRDDKWWEWEATCKVDFRVFWYGECEVWFEKMIVDDEIADKLFNPALKSENDLSLKQEAENFAGYGGLYSFFVDEVCVSQYPCIKYVFEKLKEYNPASKLSIAVTNYLHVHGLKNDTLSYNIYLEQVKPTFLQDDHHGILCGETKLPPNINITDKAVPVSWKAKNYEEYNTELQNKVLGGKEDVTAPNAAGSLIYELRKIKDCIDQYSPGTKFIAQPQIHGFIYSDTIKGGYVSGAREPTNGEIQVQAMVSIAHGANGLCWFIYNSRIWKTELSGKPILSMLGILNPEDAYSKREQNCYGENKWKYVSEVNGKIMKWIPVLETLHWVDGFSVHQNGPDNYFIEDIRSVCRNKEGLFISKGFTGSPDKILYWEEGFFIPKDKSDRSLYVLFVNRRCVPETEPGAGDIRMLTIRFKPGELKNSDKWRIIDLNNNRAVEFNKNNQGEGGYVMLGSNPGDLGYFEPGEGKLFKLEPVN